MPAPQQYKLCYLPLFWDDLNSAVTYIAQTLKNPAAAQRLLDSAEMAIFSHLKNPTMGREHATTYYYFSVGNYLAFYIVEEDTVEMRRFVYGARDLTKLRL